MSNFDWNSVGSGIKELGADELALVAGGITSAQVRDFGNAAGSVAAAGAVVGAEPIAAAGAAVAITAYMIAGFMDL